MLQKKARLAACFLEQDLVALVDRLVEGLFIFQLTAARDSALMEMAAQISVVSRMNNYWDSHEAVLKTLKQCLVTEVRKSVKNTEAIGRTLIPRYFSTIFEGGVTDLYYVLKHSKESYHNSSITLDCDQCTMVTQHGKPMFTKVCTEGRLILEFTFDDLMRIKTWHFTIRHYRELVPRSILAMHAQDPQVLEQLSKNITRMGLTNFTLNYLRHHYCNQWVTQWEFPYLRCLEKEEEDLQRDARQLCVILEPMQELMSRHKTYNISPRDCLKTCLFQKWQRMVAPPGRTSQSAVIPFLLRHTASTPQPRSARPAHNAEPTRQQTNKRRKRKNSASSTSNSSVGNTNSTNSKKKSPAGNFSLSSQVPRLQQCNRDPRYPPSSGSSSSRASSTSFRTTSPPWWLLLKCQRPLRTVQHNGST
ncbi:LIM domain-binding protein 2 [Rhincodon typus]|uniref:LIM domain-binding protein 2 n=1 Tax=Rhincodon typus TaxID=259920 RepID=UPI00202ED7A2|nr:LIM domain-binding protein 2 [Rhincodon typus]